MRRPLLLVGSLLALLGLTASAWYQSPSTVTATVSSTGTPALLQASGQAWASVRWSFDGVLVATLQPQYSKDQGQNWLNAPYSARTDATSANPTVAPTVSPAAGAQAWETPLPGNATNFRLSPTSVTTPGVVTVSGGAIYTEGVPVVAVLYDVTSGTNAALDTGTLDMAGWSAADHDFTMNGGVPAFSMQEVFDDGTSSASLVTGTAAFMGGLGLGATIGGTAGIAAATAQLPLPKRMRYQSAAIAAQTSRIRVVARR